jgi:soluble lytic murein transglycosylase
MVRSEVARGAVMREDTAMLAAHPLRWARASAANQKNVGALAGATETWLWKALAAVLAAALAALVLHAKIDTPEVDANSDAQLAQMQARIADLESKAQGNSPAAPRAAALEARVDSIEARIAAVDETANWDEAVRLGIAHALARKATGYAPGQVAHLAATIVRESHAAGLDPQLAAAVMAVESGFDPYAVSNVGAAGLMQLMPKTAFGLSKDQPVPVRGGHIFDVDRNVHLGCQYLASLIHQFSSVDRALVAYNMGPVAARKALGSSRRRAVLAGYPKLVQAARARIVEAANRPEEGTPVSAVGQIDRTAR